MYALNLRQVRALSMLTAASLAIVLSSCQLCEVARRCGGDDDCQAHARVCDKPTICALAHDLDALDAHIEKFGSVTVQHPSVWGQARLTKHREDFERIMQKDLCNFKLALQGSNSRSDQAYFMNAMALGIAASGPQAVVTPITASATQITTPTPDLPDPVKLKQNEARLPNAIGFNLSGSDKITVEPTVYLNQKARYLQALNELRRINEGDDTGDSPGYALNLIRIPVSVLPGKCTQQGHGAEVTMTLKPYVGNELLPTTFRNLVSNDLLEIIGVPLTQFLNDKEQMQHFRILWQVYDLEYAQWKNMKKVRNLKWTDLQKTSQALLRTSPLAEDLGLLNNGNLADKSKDTAWTNAQQVLKNSPLIVPATKLRHSRRPFPPSQLVEIFGEDEVDNFVLTTQKLFGRDPANKYYIHYPDVQGFLQEELAAAYRLLADPTQGRLWDHCSQALVTAIHTRNAASVKQLRGKFADEVLATTKRVMEDDITVSLAWAIIVESAVLNNQLLQDIKESADAKKCSCPITDSNGIYPWIDFYLPHPSPMARVAFRSYVECRWPIIVFALDPVTEQQNIADSYSSRREMQLALSMAFVSGQISAKNMTQYARRLETEMETVALNNTAVGFSHGNETFGWRFYPRFQTPDTESNFTVLFRDMLIGGPNRNALLRQRKLEPGQRECTAVVIMPSFVPYATLEVGTTWFSLTDPKHKNATSVEAVKLSARVKAIETCAANVKDTDCYRDGEIDRLKARAKQLEARLPLQTAMVQVPYENTLGGFAMFNTGITDLSPELYGWYGAPGIDTNDSTTIFLVGNHFSVHQTRVIVGGIHVTDTEMLSRQVMRITIPPGALALERSTGTFPDCPNPCPDNSGASATDMSATAPPDAVLPASLNDKSQPKAGAKDSAAPGDKTTTPKTGAKKTPMPTPATPPCKGLFVDIHVATPYGVTSHLLVPACKVPTGTPRPKAAVPTPPYSCPDDASKPARTAADKKETAAGSAPTNSADSGNAARTGTGNKTDSSKADLSKTSDTKKSAAERANLMPDIARPGPTFEVQIPLPTVWPDAVALPMPKQ